MRWGTGRLRPTRLALAQLIRRHQPAMVFAITDVCVHPDHAAVGRSSPPPCSMPGGEALAGSTPWNVERLFFPHWKMEPAWGSFGFAVDVSETYDCKKQALAVYAALFKIREGDELLSLYEAEDAHMGRLFGVAYAEVFKSHSPLLVTDPGAFLPGLHG